jgi:peptide/nickel transport system substrate-binding protein
LVQATAEEEEHMDEGSGLSSLTREELLRKTAVAGIAIGGGSLLATRGAKAATAASPKRGGVLKIAVGGGGAKDTIDAHQATNQPDFARVPQLYEDLTVRDAHFNLVNNLAESIEANAKANVWTVRLRDGVEFHNGKTMGADDLIFSIQRVFKLSYAPPRQTMNGVDPKRLKKMDARTVRMSLTTANSILPEAITGFYVVPVGYDPKKPVGSGPWKFTSFTPGQQSVFDANTNWWGGWEGQKGGPYTDQLQLINFNDDSARVNALLSGQVNGINAVPYGQISVIKANNNLKLLIEQSGLWRPFTMRVDLPPFNDVRVRQAMRLVVDRPQMVAQAIAGNGRVGNDLYSPQDPVSLSSILPQRHQDIEQAKSLLKQAGQENLTVQLTTGEIEAGVLEASQVLVPQAAKAGITIKLNQIDSGTFYGSNYLKYPFAVDWWGTSPYLVQSESADGPTAQWNETHWKDPKFDSLYRQALSTVDAGKRKELEQEMQRIQYERGGYIIAYFPNTIDAYSAKLTGWVPYNNGTDFSNWRFHQAYFV